MARRRNLFSGPKRKSYKAGPIKLNTKGFVGTSVSVGGKNSRLNLSSRGLRTSTKIPGTNIRVEGHAGTGRRRKANVPAPVHAGAESAKKKGCLRGCSPLVLLLVTALIVLVIVGVV